VDLLLPNNRKEIQSTNDKKGGSTNDSKEKAKALLKKIHSTKFLSLMTKATLAGLVAMGRPPLLIH